MGRDWKKVKVDDLKAPQKYSCVGGPFGSSLSRKHYVESQQVPIIRGVNLSGDVFHEEGFVFVSEDKADELHRNLANAGDLIFTQRGTLGQVALIPSKAQFERYVVSQSQMRLTVDLKKADPYYIFSYFRLVSVKKRIEQSAIVGGVPHINLGILKDFEVDLPPLPIQKKISEVVKNLDNKIELNRQTNQTLEQMAQTLFKSWFVDFDPVFDNLLALANYQLANLPVDFPEELHPKAVTRLAALNACIPSQEHENERLASIHDRDNATLPHPDFPSEFEFNEQLGWVPFGWESGTLASVAQYTASRMEGTELNVDNYVSTENMIANKGGVTKASSVPSVKTTPSFIPGNILISNIRPYFKKIWLATSNGGRSNDVLGFVSLVPETEGYLMNLLYQDDFFDYMLRTSKGSKMPRGDKKAIMDWSIVVPPIEIRSSYSKIVKEFYEVITIRTEENISLTKLRDTLLPKLISGELQIPDLEPRSHALRGNA